MKDSVGQNIEAGQMAVWCSYNQIWQGRVKKVTARRVIMESYTERGISSWRHMPVPQRVMIVEALPKQVLFWMMKGPRS
jgi:hypothetical protein